MAALGIPTTRALAAATTGDTVWRETGLPGAVLTRVAASHIRVGTFQFFAARGEEEALRRLADHVIERHYPQAAAAPSPYRALLEGVIARQAALVARWLHVGFIHGVMNTDNMSIAGETIDYGPCAFLDTYDPAAVFSSIDRSGRYAYANQPAIAQWNLVRLAECLLPLLASDEEAAVEEAKAALANFGPIFNEAYLAGLSAKLGLAESRDGDFALGQGLLKRMAENKADFTLVFRRLGEAVVGLEGDGAVRVLFADPTAYDGWTEGWRARLATEGREPAAVRAAMHGVNAAFIPRNHRIEAMITAALGGDYAPFEDLLTILARPYDEQPGFANFAEPPPPSDTIYRTFCGT